MLARHYAVTHQPFEVVVARLIHDHQKVFTSAIAKARREIDVIGVRVDQMSQVSSEGATVGTLRRTPSHAVIPFHWWSSHGTDNRCDVEGDLDVSPVILDRTLLTLRGHFSISNPHVIGEATESRVCALALRAFLEGLTFAAVSSATG